MKLFEANTYKNRRSALVKHVNSGIIFFLGNREMPMNFTDNAYHFRQDSTFLYFFGLTKSGLAAIIDADSGESVIYGDNPSIDEIVWTGPQTEISELALQVGVSKTASYNSLMTDINEAKNSGRQIHFLAPYRHDHQIELGTLLSIGAEQIASSWSRELVEGIVAQRLYKSPEELEELGRAVDITADMHLTAMREAKPGMKEQHVVARVMEVAAENGGHFSFQPIVTINGETLHNHYYGNTLNKGDLLLVDTGAETEMGYAGDMTRTFPIGQNFDSRQRDLYQLVYSNSSSCDRFASAWYFV